jgi:hypothetical protein
MELETQHRISSRGAAICHQIPRTKKNTKTTVHFFISLSLFKAQVRKTGLCIAQNDYRYTCIFKATCDGLRLATRALRIRYGWRFIGINGGITNEAGAAYSVIGEYLNTCQSGKDPMSCMCSMSKGSRKSDSRIDRANIALRFAALLRRQSLFSFADLSGFR